MKRQRRTQAAAVEERVGERRRADWEEIKDLPGNATLLPPRAESSVPIKRTVTFGRNSVEVFHDDASEEGGDSAIEIMESSYEYLGGDELDVSWTGEDMDDTMDEYPGRTTPMPWRQATDYYSPPRESTAEQGSPPDDGDARSPSFKEALAIFNRR